MIININGGNGGGGGGSYTLPIASASVLGGVKVGSGLTIDNTGRLSTEAQSGASEDWAWYSVEEYNELSKNEKRAIYEEIKALVESGETKIGFYSYTEETDGDDNPILNYERYVFSHYQDEQIYFQGVFAYRNIEDDEDKNGYFVSKCLRLDLTHMEWYNYDSIDGGGSGDSNYVIVDSLEDIDEPTEGLMAWVKTESAVSSTYKIYISDPNSWEGWDGDRPEGMLGHFTDGVNEDLNLYLSTDNFYWDWDNSGEWRTREYYGSFIPYRTHNVDGTGGAWFETGELPEGITFAPASGVSNEAITAATYLNGVSYVYRNGSWKKMSAVYFINRNQFVDSAETVAFHDQLQRDLDGGNVPVIFETQMGITLNYAGVEFKGLKFYGNIWNSAAQIIIAGADGYFDSEGFNPAGIKWDEGAVADTTQYQRTIELSSGGTFSNPDQLAMFAEENHTDTIIFKMDGDYGTWSQAPVKYVYRTRSQEEDPLVYHFAVEIPVNGTLYRGVWHLTENDWGNYVTDTWAAVS